MTIFHIDMKCISKTKYILNIVSENVVPNL